jgi:predicted RNA binding protein YcfA (HicA-like mRNA interferase family)
LSPPEVNHARVIKLLTKHGYAVVRQRGSHIRLSHQGPPQHHLSVPRHRIVRYGTLHKIIVEAAIHLHMPVDELLKEL